MCKTKLMSNTYCGAIFYIFAENNPFWHPVWGLQLQGNDSFGWSVLGWIYVCYCCLAVNQPAPVLATGLPCLAVHRSLVLVSSCFLLSPLTAGLCCWSPPSAVPGNALITATAICLGWQGAKESLLCPCCCPCAAALNSLQFHREFQLKGLWPVRESTVQQDMLKCLWLWMSPYQSKYTSKHLWPWLCLCDSRNRFEIILTQWWRRHTSKYLWLWMTMLHQIHKKYQWWK